MKFILQSCMITVMLFLLYWGALLVIPPWRGDGMIWEQNRIRAEKYFLSQNAPTVVIVGSSISVHIRDLPAGWYNLAFDGGSAMSGLEIIAHTPSAPKLVLIETNMIARASNPTITERVTHPATDFMLRHVLAARTENKPAHVAWLATAKFRGILRLFPDSKSTPPGIANNPTETATANSNPNPELEKLGQIRLQNRIASLQSPPDEGQLSRVLEDLAFQIQHLRQRGVHVVFFEVPEAAECWGTPYKETLRNVLKTFFPPDAYKWVPDAQPGDFSTRDAVHLDSPSGTKYSSYFRSAVTQLCLRMQEQ